MVKAEEAAFVKVRTCGENQARDQVTISWETRSMLIRQLNTQERVTICMRTYRTADIAEIEFWRGGKLVDTYVHSQQGFVLKAAA